MEHKISHDSETPAHGQQVITANAFIHTTIDGVHKVFLAKRAPTKKFFPNVFELPGGHIEWGEDIVVGLKREIQEELGVEVSIGDPFAAFTYRNDVKGSHSIEVEYFASISGPLEAITLHPEDHVEGRWFSETELTSVQGSMSPEEFQSVSKGFELLRNVSPHFA